MEIHSKENEICKDLEGDKHVAEIDLARASLLRTEGKIRVCSTCLPLANLLQSNINITLKTAQLVELQAVQIFTHPLPKHINPTSKRLELAN
jgi:hypothetical protein